MYETSKTRRLARDSFPNYLLVGRGIDIGSGQDLVSVNAEPFDKTHGDANDILRHKKAGAYDFVYSSHTLEHMNNPKECIKDWFTLLKTGGYMVLIVPDSELYEQGCFPSTFNSDHKWQFTLSSKLGGHSLLTVDELLGELNDYKIISKELQDFNYDYSLKSDGSCWIGKLVGKLLSRLVCALKKCRIKGGQRLIKIAAKILKKTLGARIDQTLLFDSTAQIQIIVQKTA